MNQSSSHRISTPTEYLLEVGVRVRRGSPSVSSNCESLESAETSTRHRNDAFCGVGNVFVPDDPDQEALGGNLDIAIEVENRMDQKQISRMDSAFKQCCGGRESERVEWTSGLRVSVDQC